MFYYKGCYPAVEELKFVEISIQEVVVNGSFGPVSSNDIPGS